MMEMLGMFATTYVSQLMGYFAVCTIVFVGVWWLGSDLFVSRRIHIRGRTFDRRQWVDEVRNTLWVLCVGTLQVLLVMALQEQGWTTLPDDVENIGVVGVGFAVLSLLLFNDLWFYIMHRMLHTPWLFKHVHSVHHRSMDVNPYSSYSFHVVEAVMMTGWFIPVAMVVPLPMPVLGVVQMVGLANNLMAHLGYEMLPVWWLRIPILRWSNSATFHSEHHTRFKGNFGLFTRIWDRLFDTELDGYDERFLSVHASADQSDEMKRSEQVGEYV